MGSGRGSGDGDAAARRVRDFYERDGWRVVDGQSGDARRWGTAPSGPRQAALHAERTDRIRQLLRPTGDPASPVRLVEFGSGGQPAAWLFDSVASYTIVDFSREGLAAAADVLPAGSSRIEADVRRLPLADGAYDIAYSAHMIYHLATADDQARALQEMVRVVRPGGVLGVVMAVPYPWLFPDRCLRRAVASAPVLGDVADRLRPRPPLPYLPMPAGWMAEVLAPVADVRVHPYAVATTSFARRVGERSALGRAAWATLYHLETGAPALAQRLGAYSLIVAHRRAAREHAATHRPRPGTRPQAAAH